MKIVLTILSALSLIGMIYCIIGMYKSYKLLNRNKEVSKFRTWLLDIASEYNIRHIKEIGTNEITIVYNWFIDKWSYEEMLYSSKPLTLEEWYTPEEINKIKS